MTGTGSAAGGGDGRRTSSRAAGAGWVALGSLLALAGVAAGAFGAHGLRGRLEPEALQVFEVAVRYQMYHALALVLVGLLAQGPGKVV
ncbi:MAG: DUF423 domain-containing protein [Planctomycetes bacterium]|nr:DUF423 domain-containing protein [Planctomycetota bacterium]